MNDDNGRQLTTVNGDNGDIVVNERTTMDTLTTFFEDYLETTMDTLTTIYRLWPPSEHPLNTFYPLKIPNFNSTQHSNFNSATAVTTVSIQ